MSKPLIGEGSMLGKVVSGGLRGAATAMGVPQGIQDVVGKGLSWLNSTLCTMEDIVPLEQMIVGYMRMGYSSVTTEKDAREKIVSSLVPMSYAYGSSKFVRLSPTMPMSVIPTYFLGSINATNNFFAIGVGDRGFGWVMNVLLALGDECAYQISGMYNEAASGARSSNPEGQNKLLGLIRTRGKALDAHSGAVLASMSGSAESIVRFSPFSYHFKLMLYAQAALLPPTFRTEYDGVYYLAPTTGPMSVPTVDQIGVGLGSITYFPYSPFAVTLPLGAAPIIRAAAVDVATYIHLILNLIQNGPSPITLNTAVAGSFAVMPILPGVAENAVGLGLLALEFPFNRRSFSTAALVDINGTVLGGGTAFGASDNHARCAGTQNRVPGPLKVLYVVGPGQNGMTALAISSGVSSVNIPVTSLNAGDTWPVGAEVDVGPQFTQWLNSATVASWETIYASLKSLFGMHDHIEPAFQLAACHSQIYPMGKLMVKGGLRPLVAPLSGPTAQGVTIPWYSRYNPAESSTFKLNNTPGLPVSPGQLIASSLADCSISATGVFLNSLAELQTLQAPSGEIPTADPVTAVTIAMGLADYVVGNRSMLGDASLLMLATNSYLAATMHAQATQIFLRSLHIDATSFYHYPLQSMAGIRRANSIARMGDPMTVMGWHRSGRGKTSEILSKYQSFSIYVNSLFSRGCVVYPGPIPGTAGSSLSWFRDATVPAGGSSLLYAIFPVSIVNDVATMRVSAPSVLARRSNWANFYVPGAERDIKSTSTVDALGAEQSDIEAYLDVDYNPHDPRGAGLALLEAELRIGDPGDPTLTTGAVFYKGTDTEAKFNSPILLGGTSPDEQAIANLLLSWKISISALPTVDVSAQFATTNRFCDQTPFSILMGSTIANVQLRLGCKAAVANVIFTQGGKAVIAYKPIDEVGVNSLGSLATAGQPSRSIAGLLPVPYGSASSSSGAHGAMTYSAPSAAIGSSAAPGPTVPGGPPASSVAVSSTPSVAVPDPARLSSVTPVVARDVLGTISGLTPIGDMTASGSSDRGDVPGVAATVPNPLVTPTPRPLPVKVAVIPIGSAPPRVVDRVDASATVMPSDPVPAASGSV